MEHITAEHIRQAIDYNQLTGVLTRKTGPKAGLPTGTLSKDGYLIVRILGTNVYAHRIAWLHLHGRWPVQFIDHIDGNKTNNCISNLRECSTSQNAQNKKRHSNNTTGFIGVCKTKTGFLAQLTVKGKKRFVAYCSTAEEAFEKYTEAKKRLHLFQPEIRAS